MDLKEIFLSFSDFAHQRNICYDFQCNPVEIVCWFDAKQLEKVFFNLLSNAFKYTPDGGKIGMIIATDNGNVKIQICDTGSGISDLDSAHIFDRFYQGGNQKGNEQSPGTGIGLALTKSIVEKHHGAISVESEVGKGSTFTIALSLNMSIYQEDEHIQFVDSVSDMMTTTGPLLGEKIASFYEVPVDSLSQETAKENDRKLLLVEDNETMLEFMSERLREVFTVETATNGQEALEVLRNRRIDLVISDIMMPVMNGWELCKEIKSDMDLSHIPVIFLTAKNDIDSKINGLKYGAEAYVEKPFSFNYLKEQVLSLLDNRRREREAFAKRPFFSVNNMQMNKADEEFMNKVIRIIEDNITDDNFGVEKMADILCMSRSSLLRKIKTIFNLSPLDFIRLIRLKKAAEYIQEGKYRIGDICYMVGINSPSYFSKLFLKQFGMTPKDFEKQYQSGKQTIIPQDIRNTDTINDADK